MMSCRTIASDFMPRNSNIQAIWHGHKWRGGRRTDQVGTVFALRKKRPRGEVAVMDMIPAEIEGAPTDVVEIPLIEAPRPPMPRAIPFDVVPFQNTGRVRPCPAGFSLGHPTITAGTLGLWVKYGPTEDWHILTNAHVGAPHWSTNVRPGDFELQPGPHDQGQNPGDRIAELVEWGTIRFQGQVPGKKNAAIGRAWWSSVKNLGNLGAWLARCPFRMRVGPLAIDQPWERNRVDGALARALSLEMVQPEIEGIGQPTDFGNARVGAFARKNGRTTGLTELVCTGIDGVVNVSYGGGRIGAFDNQDIYVHRDGVSAGSAGGDSGSAIVSDDGSEFWSLLYAGGSQQGGPDITIGNKSSDVLALFGNGLRLS